MGRTNTKAILQPNDLTCGPTSLKTALEILGVRRSLKSLIPLCKTNSNGSSVPNFIRAANKCGLYVMAVEGTTLRQVKSVLKTSRHTRRAAIMNYLSQDEEPFEETGHYATLASFSTPKNRIVLFDSAQGKKTSFAWPEFVKNWYDYDYRRVKSPQSDRYLQLYRRWYNRLMLVMSEQREHLPNFKSSLVKIYAPN